MNDKVKRILLIDANSVIHRAYHALPPLTTKKGELINVVYGFLLVFLRAIKDFRSDYVVAAFDLPALTFRHKKFKAYKAKRPPTPKELCQQIPKVKQILKSFNVPIFEKKGFEADDIIGTITSLSSVENIILSGDLDLFQLINPKTKVYLLKKGVKEVVLYNENLVKERFQGLEPKQILDFKALKGDVSDNIPGVPGVGEKTAIKLILEFNNLENLYKELEKSSKKTKNLKPKLKEALLKYKEQAFLSKMLAEIKKDVPINFDLKEEWWKRYDKQKVEKILKKFEFYSLIKKLPGIEEEGMSDRIKKKTEQKKLF